MTEREWNQVLRMLGKSRDKYDEIGEKELAQQCDDAITLVQSIALDPRI